MSTDCQNKYITMAFTVSADFTQKLSNHDINSDSRMSEQINEKSITSVSILSQRLIIILTVSVTSCQKNKCQRH